MNKNNKNDISSFFPFILDTVKEIEYDSKKIKDIENICNNINYNNADDINHMHAEVTSIIECVADQFKRQLMSIPINKLIKQLHVACNLANNYHEYNKKLDTHQLYKHLNDIPANYPPNNIFYIRIEFVYGTYYDIPIMYFTSDNIARDLNIVKETYLRFINQYYYNALKKYEEIYHTPVSDNISIKNAY